MNRELTNSFPERSDSKRGRRSLLGMAAAVLAGSLAACATAPQAPSRSATLNSPDEDSTCNLRLLSY
jgi:spermidine/putrescine-binding protein